MIKYKPCVLVISAASGTGKTTVIKKVLELRKDLFYSVSATTRPRREGEVDGKDYIFLSHQMFKEWIEQGKFLEWAEVYGEFYGTPKEPILRAMERGQSVIADLDIHGMRKLRAYFKDDLVSVFLFPPDFQTLINRLKARGTETPQQLEIRIKKVRSELKNAVEYDYWVLNDDVEKAAAKILAILEAKTAESKRLVIQEPF